MSETKIYHITPAGKLNSMPAFKGALAAVKKGGFLWLDYLEPTREELSTLIEPLGLHPLAVEDCTDENQIPKIEDYPHHTFILVNSFLCSERDISFHEVDLLIGKNFVVSVSGRRQDGQPVLNGIAHFIELNMEKACQGPAFLAHTILDQVVDKKFTAIETLEDELNEAEDSILADLSHFDPAELMRLRRNLLTLRKSLFHEREVLVKICRRDSPFIAEKAIFYYRDVYDHLAKFFELTETSREIVTNLMEMYLTMINNEMAKSANDTNAIVRRLTFITTIFMPLTLLAGIGGMSEWSMMTGPQNWKISYPIFFLVMAVIGAANYYFLKWLEKKDKLK